MKNVTRALATGLVLLGLAGCIPTSPPATDAGTSGEEAGFIAEDLTVSTPDGIVVVTFPAGALPPDATPSITIEETNDQFSSTDIFHLEPVGLDLLAAASVSIRYERQTTDEMVGAFVDGVWRAVPEAIYDTGIWSFAISKLVPVAVLAREPLVDETGYYGQIMDWVTGAPISGVSVKVNKVCCVSCTCPAAINTSTDGYGYFTFQVPEAGDYYVDLTRANYKPRTGVSLGTLTVPPPSFVKYFYMEPAGSTTSLRGRAVYTCMGTTYSVAAPGTGSNIFAAPEPCLMPCGQWPWSARSDANGYFLLSLAMDQYAIKVQQPGIVTKTEVVNLATWPAFTIKTITTTVDNAYKLTVSGPVMSSFDYRRIVGATVTIKPEPCTISCTPTATTTTNAEGRFSALVPPGKYSFGFSKNGQTSTRAYVFTVCSNFSWNFYPNIPSQ